MSLFPLSLSPLRALSILHELTVEAQQLFDTVEPLDSFLLKMASRLDARVILLWQAPLEGGMHLLGSAGLSRQSRRLNLQNLRLEQLKSQPAQVLPYPECQDAKWFFVSLQLGSEHSEYGLTLCFGSKPAPYLSGSLKQLGQMLYRMLSARGNPTMDNLTGYLAGAA
jgi:hypothetical protein